MNNNSSNHDCSSNSNSTSSLVNSNSAGGRVADRRDLGSHFLGLARLGAAWAPGPVDEAEESPTELNTINSSGGFLVVSTDKLSVKYTGVNLHGHDVGVVQGNRPAPVRRFAYYFEIYVKDAGVKGQIGIGFTSENFKMRRQPGWEPNSCGYHGDDGFLYRGQGKGEPFGPTYTSGDKVGAGINYATQEFFFTKNNTVVGTVYKDMKGPLFPTVSVHSQNEEIDVNFGQKPFAFDIKAYEVQERMRQQATIEKISLPPNISYGIVRSYLLHYGYEDTLSSFDMASKSTIPPISLDQENGFDEQEILYALNQRKTLRQLIQNGEIDAAFSKLRDWYPQVIQDEKSATCFLLHCQKFIELVRVGALEEAIKYGRVELSRFFDMASFKDLVQDCVSLMAYEYPKESFAGYLLEESQREVVADTVNAMILATNPSAKDFQGCLHSYLERLLRQLTACCLERRSLNGDQGEAFHLHRVLHNSNTRC
ncbi:hypothetical protein BT93_F3333 [Corymbia citriodora subsp. variegata]|nr:hypothetical protein BT93_F3333 [Corymbia citriodora subsp. variegata]